VTELPEIEVIRKDLERTVLGKRFKDVTVKTPGIVGRHRNRPEFVKALQGRKIEGVTRRGTALVLQLDDDAVLVILPGPQATLTRETATEEPSRHTQAVTTFTTGGALHYVDPTKDGELFVISSAEANDLADLRPTGIDPLSDMFTWPTFGQHLETRATTLKQLLIDPSFIIGLGDVYSDEILWAAGLSGERDSGSLSSQEVRRLYRAVLEVLYEAVKQRGSADAAPADPTDPFAEASEAGTFIRVYGREGEPCARCRQPIRKGKVGRGAKALVSYYCPQCQT
jgi:formamidopyrimidine-DNA glycosylase